LGVIPFKAEENMVIVIFDEAKKSIIVMSKRLARYHTHGLYTRPTIAQFLQYSNYKKSMVLTVF
jgi:hypothetical protein